GPAGDAAAPGSPARSLDGDLSHRAPAVAVDLVGDDLRRRGEVLRELLLHRLEVRGVHVRARTLVGERLDEHVGVRVLHAAGALDPQVPGLGQGGLGELVRDLGPLVGELGLHGELHVDEDHRPVLSEGAAPACPEAAERGSPILARQEPAPHQGPCGTMRAAAERGAMSIVEERGEEAPAGQIARALAVLEAVAEHGSSTARGIADATGIPLPTVYRIAQRSPPSSPTRVPTFLAYEAERRIDRRRRNPMFGKGAIRGLAAPEAAGNATTGMAMGALLALGLPVSATAAIMLAAFRQYGLQPGPLLFENSADLVWALLASFFLAMVVLLIINLPFAQLWAKLLLIPKPYLYGGIALFCGLGIWATSGAVFDLLLLLGIAVIGFLMRRYDYPVAPLMI